MDWNTMSKALIPMFFWVTLVHAQTIVDTEYGQVRGHVVNVDNGREQTTVEVYYGIPFAKPPVGSLRFTGPERPDAWTGILEGDTLGDACPQSLAYLRTSNPQWPREKVSEDCLHLNVYTPTSGTGPYAVMVWMFGGGYQVGANIQFPGHFLASRGVIIVTVNYRVGSFGFSYTGNAASPGNAGMLDQNLGLQFVVDNIGNFGGDTSRITVFGESAGATSSALHMLSPMSNTLFQQAIMQSGAEVTFWGVSPPDSNPADYTRQIAEQLDCLRADDFQMMDCLRSLSWETIHENSTVTCTPGYICLGMAPVVDGPGGFLPQMPADLRASGEVISGPIMAGINHEDGSIFTSSIAPAIVLQNCCNRTYFSYVLENNVAGFYETRLANTTLEDVYHAFDFQYTPWPDLYNNTNNRDRLVDLVTDVAFGIAWDRQLKDHSQIAPTYAYVLDRTSDVSPDSDWLGTSHGADLAYVWGNCMLHFNEEVAEDSWTRSSVNYTDADVQYSIFIQDLWTNFAKFGNPTPSPVDNPLGGSTLWSDFTFEDMNILYLGGTEIRVQNQWLQKDYAFWSEYLNWMAGDELNPGSDGFGVRAEDLLVAIHQGFAMVMMNDGRLDELMDDIMDY